MNIATTRGLNGGNALPTQAKKWARLLEVPYIERQGNGSLQAIKDAYNLDGILVATKNGPQLFSDEGILFYHPGMAVLRLQKIFQGEQDNFVAACELKLGSRILDATLGFASDAAIASYVVGNDGLVQGLEASKPLWFLVTEGLQHYVSDEPLLDQALRRIKTKWTEAGIYLKTLASDSFDVVYFDPMFKYPVKLSSNMKPLRPMAYTEPLVRATLTEALRVAPLVVVKERTPRVLRDLGINELLGSKYSKVKYGILRRKANETT
ncbi:MAG: class I SAM-dependent methyltransferase [Acidaminococcaceae bacterium]|nr:class I SAM-dependent methyltransferase [Acidaminococcaceae bacterium]